jgi:hypothetical protein
MWKRVSWKMMDGVVMDVCRSVRTGSIGRDGCRRHGMTRKILSVDERVGHVSSGDRRERVRSRSRMSLRRHLGQRRLGRLHGSDGSVS